MGKTKTIHRKKKHLRKRGDEASQQLPPWLPPAAVAAVFLVLGYRLFDLISDYAVNIFFSDQWDFDDATLFQKHSLWQMFTWQHGPHRQGAGALLGWLVEPLFHWNSRTESFFVGAIVVVAALSALFLKRRLFGDIWYSDVIILLLFLCPMQFETLFVTANLAHGPLPVLFVLLYCLAWTIRSVPVRYGLVLGINFVTIYTGFGIFLGLLTPILLVVDFWVNLRGTLRGKVYFLAALVLCLVSFASFFIGYKNQPAADCFAWQLQSPTDYAWYAALMFAPFFGLLGGDTLPSTVGAVAVCALIASLVWSGVSLLRVRGAQWMRFAASGILTAYCLLFCFSTSYGRLCLGIQYAQSSRYVIYLELGLLGLYFVLLSLPKSMARTTLIAIFGLSLLGTFSSGAKMRNEMMMLSDIKNGWRKCYLTLGDLQRCNKYARVYPWDPEKTRLQEKLDFLKKTHQNLFSDLP
jgi:hypothetical protein